MSVEHERSFVFTHAGAKKFVEDHNLVVEDAPHDTIEDFYLNVNLRIRKITNDNGVNYILTRKCGDKAKGYRIETEKNIDEHAASLLVEDACLRVKKIRHELPVMNSEYIVTMDFIEEPMRLAILEIEATKEIVYPIPSDITSKLFGVELRECPLSACSLFKRKVGICGGPSTGKSETAKILSHILNTQFGANSFHVVEFATTFIQKYQKNPKFMDQFFVWHGQHEREHNAESANIVLSDCPTFLSYVYLLHLTKDKFSVDTALVLAKIYKRVLFDVGSYTDIILMNPMNYVQNKVRYQSPEEAKVISSRIRGFLDDHNISYSDYNYSQTDTILSDLFYINS